MSLFYSSGMSSEKLTAWRQCYVKLQEAQRHLLASVESLDEAGIDRYGKEVAEHQAACNRALQDLHNSLEAARKR